MVQSAPAPASGAPKERDEYTAKQVATRIGTDPKTLRKFFRSDASTVEPAGQGGRYVFPASDLDQIRTEFEAWKTKAATRRSSSDGTGRKRGRKATPAVILEEDDEILEFDDDEEPSEEALDEIAEEDDDNSIEEED